MKKERRRKRSRGRRILGLILELIVAVVLVVVIIVYKQTYGKMEYVGNLDKKEISSIFGEGSDEEPAWEGGEGYTNIALFGLDNRSSGSLGNGNSDTIMIASIDNKSGDIKLVSVYRDTLLNIYDKSGGNMYRKANAAFANGGAARAVGMLNKNLDLDITEFVCVDWLAVVEAIDALGGIDLELTSNEISQINKYMGDVEEMSGYTSYELSESDGEDGVYHLDGVQGTTYARIRKTSGDDYLRSSRQRIVLEKMLQKAKKAKLTSLTKLCSAIFDDISTSLSLPDILKLAKGIRHYNIVSTTGFPFELTTKHLEKTNDTIVPVGLARNVSALHEYMFGETDYEPSERVQAISDDIIYISGVSSNAATIDLSLYNETVGANGTEDTKTQNRSESDGE